jgi:hypothetical protein
MYYISGSSLVKEYAIVVVVLLQLLQQKSGIVN